MLSISRAICNRYGIKYCYSFALVLRSMVIEHENREKNNFKAACNYTTSKSSHSPSPEQKVLCGFNIPKQAWVLYPYLAEHYQIRLSWISWLSYEEITSWLQTNQNWFHLHQDWKLECFSIIRTSKESMDPTGGTTDSQFGIQQSPWSL